MTDEIYIGNAEAKMQFTPISEGLAAVRKQTSFPDPFNQDTAKIQLLADMVEFLAGELLRHETKDRHS